MGHEIVAGARGVRASLPEAGDGAVDEARIVRCETLVVEAKLGQAADLEILDQHVGAGREFLHDALALRGVEIKLDRPLAAVGAVKIGGAKMAAIGGRHEGRAPAAGVVAGALAFHLDHVGTEIGQKLPRPWPGQNSGKLQYAQASQWTRIGWTRHETLPIRHGGAAARGLSVPAGRICLQVAYFFGLSLRPPIIS